MISYHLAPPLGSADRYFKGFKTADTNDVTRLAKGITLYAWSPCIWEGGWRRQENFLRADWCVLDFDSPEMALAEAEKVFCDCIHIIGTTKSHQKEKRGVTCDRFRVMLLFERPITNVEDYRYTMTGVIKRYPADPAPKDGARFFYPCKTIISLSADGFTEPVLVRPKQDIEREAARAFMQKAQLTYRGRLPFWVEDFLSSGKLCKSSGRHSTVYAVARAMAEYQVAFDEAARRITEAPFDRADFDEYELTRVIRDGFTRGKNKP